MSDSAAPNTESTARNWRTIVHLSSFATFFIPVGNILAPIVIWLIRKEEQPELWDDVREVLNFNITYILAVMVCGILSIIGIGLVLMLIAAVAWLVLAIIAAVKVSGGETYRYPSILRLVN